MAAKFKEGIARDAEATEITGLGRSTRYKMEKAGTFPQRIQITAGLTGYLRKDLYEWVEKRAQEPRQCPAKLPVSPGRKRKAA